MHGKTDWRGSKVHQNTELSTKLMVNRWNSSEISSQDSRRCSSATKFKSYCWDWVKHQRILQYGLSSCRCSTTSHGDLKTMKKNANQVLSSFLSVRKDFHKDNGFSFGLGSEKKWYSTHEYNPQGEWDRGAEQMMLTFAESKHPIFRSTSPLSRGVLKSKGGVKLSIHFCADGETVETVFRTIISVNRLSIHGAVSDLCEECNTCHDRTGRLVVAGQSSPLFVPSVMMTHIPLTDDPAQEEDLLQRYQERIEKLSQHTEWLNFVLMQDSWPQLKSDSTSWQKTLKNSHNLQSQWLVVSTLCQEMKTYLNQKGWIRGNTKIGRVLEITNLLRTR